MDISLKGKSALVCGASQGIGAATAYELAELGAEVTLLARSKDKLEKVCRSLPGEGHRYVAVDISDRAALAVELDEILSLAKNQSIEVLVCNSGGPKGGPLLAAEDDEYINAFANHILVNSLLAKKLIPAMKKCGYGRIINVISTSVKIPIPNLGVSNTIRAAVAGWAKTLSVEVAADGITVNNVLPGYTDTPRLSSLIEGASKRLGKTVPEMTEIWRGTVPMKRFAKPEETAAAIAFLASPAAAYISGVSIPVDGGRTGSL